MSGQSSVAGAGPALTEEQQAVFERIESGHEHLFVTGRAGTGKSTVLNHLAWNTAKQIAVCAPTGVAALNVSGQTIHSLLRLPIGVIAGERLTRPEETDALLNAIDTLVIDEVSMVNADLMDAIDRVLREARRREREPFGGVQIVMFGDPFQLPPVPPRDPHERAYFADNYRSMWFFDAKVWQEATLSTVELSQVHRQADAGFVRLLNAVRHGRVTAEMAQELNAAGARRPPGGLLTLATRNDTVDAINSRELEGLPGRARTAEALVTGEFGNVYPADPTLRLKPGARVMFLRNDTAIPGAPRWANGTIGTVTSLGQVVRVEVAGQQHEVTPSVWEKLRYEYSPATRTLDRVVVGEFEQFPLRLAWAVTIHKSQGQSYDAAVIDLGSRAFSPGQSYVALSRIRSLEGVYLRRPLRPADVQVDPDVQRFLGL